MVNFKDTNLSDTSVENRVVIGFPRDLDKAERQSVAMKIFIHHQIW